MGLLVSMKGLLKYALATALLMELVFLFEMPAEARSKGRNVKIGAHTSILIGHQNVSNGHQKVLTGRQNGASCILWWFLFVSSKRSSLCGILFIKRSFCKVFLYWAQSSGIRSSLGLAIHLEKILYIVVYLQTELLREK